MTLDQLLGFVPAALLVGASPGANNLLALTNGVRSGLRPRSRACRAGSPRSRS